MKTISIPIAFLLVGACIAAPADRNDDTLVVTKHFYVKNLVKYSSEHDIVKIMIPLNSMQDVEAFKSDSSLEEDIIIFFVEADVDDKGNRVYKGLYSLQNGKVKKVLENGRDAAASADNSKLVFIGASDGLYVYNNDDSAEKYGSIDDSIIGIAKEKSGDIIYILTDDHIVYKVSENGTKKEKLEDVVNAKQIVLDFSDNLYFLSDDKIPHVRSAEGVKKIEGLPENPSYIDLLRPPFILENGVLFVSDEIVHLIFANGTSERIDIKIQAEARPSAYAPEAAAMQYYAHDKKIYEYDILTLIFASSMDAINAFRRDKSDDIKFLPSQSKINIRD